MKAAPFSAPPARIRRRTSLLQVSAPLPPLPVLPPPHVLEGSGRRVRGHQPVTHPLVDQGGVGRHGAQQQREAPGQQQADAAGQRGTDPTSATSGGGGRWGHRGYLTSCGSDGGLQAAAGRCEEQLHPSLWPPAEPAAALDF